MISQEEFKEALRAVASSEFADIPANPPEHTFSPRFEKKMKRLLDSVNKRGKAPMRALHKAAITAAVSFIIIATSVTQIKAIREPFMELFTNICKTFIDIDFVGNGPGFIVYEYQLNYVPEEFTLIDKQSTPSNVYYKYQNTAEDTITFIQRVVKDTQASIDNEQGELKTIQVSDIEVLIYESDFCIEALWIQGAYYMNLTCIGDFDEATVIDMIESMEAVENAAN